MKTQSPSLLAILCYCPSCGNEGHFFSNEHLDHGDNTFRLETRDGKGFTAVQRYDQAFGVCVQCGLSLGKNNNPAHEEIPLALGTHVRIITTNELALVSLPYLEEHTNFDALRYNLSTFVGLSLPVWKNDLDWYKKNHHCSILDYAPHSIEVLDENWMLPEDKRLPLLLKEVSK